MRSPLILSTVVFLVIGSVGAGLYANRNATNAATTSRALIASMINPSTTLTSPRTYNQTLVETINTVALVDTLQAAGLPISAVSFDVLPDSFHIQSTATATTTLDDTTNAAVATAIGTAVQSASTELIHALFAQNNPEPTATVVVTKVLPQTATLQQSPIGAMIYGAIAGALFGWFIGLTLADQKRRT